MKLAEIDGIYINPINVVSLEDKQENTPDRYVDVVFNFCDADGRPHSEKIFYMTAKEVASIINKAMKE